MRQYLNDTGRMKRTIYTGIAAGIAAITSISCNSADELPPLNEGYATEYILPDPVDLTAEDRAVIEALEKEYNEAISSSN
ncbi:MAG: hypothetical protein K2O58_08010 [Bacteroidales bacterium]|nr:hypothetical protein [Bacteroidales bacterium]MDE7127819.1 hypothetical protein [Bacteroidales bacterium]